LLFVVLLPIVVALIASGIELAGFDDRQIQQFIGKGEMWV